MRLLPVTTRRRKPVGTVSLAHLGGVFIPRVSEPRLMRQVHTSLAAISRALKGRALALFHEDRVEDLYVRLGTMDIRSFWSVSVRENIPAAQSIIIVGDRRDVQRRAIELGIRALVITSGLEVSPEIAAEAAFRTRVTAPNVFVRGRRCAISRRNSIECPFFCSGYFNGSASPSTRNDLA